jgi:GDP-4-dehydro-6-deoxy-D-mannose reductase
LATLLLTGHRGFAGQSILSRLRDTVGWQAATLPDTLDVRSPELGATVAAIRPDAVLHLAALTSVAESFRDPDEFFSVNFHGTWNLLRALRDNGFAGRLIYVSSGDCYGSIAESALPVGELTPLKPRSPYAVAKVAAEALCYQWSQTEKIDAVIARPFNHIGPGQDERFVIASFARQIARILAGAAPPQLRCGDLTVTRDFTDVRDVVGAYFALLRDGRTGEVYNIGSGRETCVGDVLAMLIEIAGIEVEASIDPAMLRADEQRRVVADVTKIANDTGWRANIPMHRTLTDTLEYWKAKVADE